MKITFEFDTASETFEHSELYRAEHSLEMALTINEILETVRSWYKYGNREAIPVDEIQEKICDIVNEHVNVNEMLV